MRDREQLITLHMIQFCYTCGEAHKCDTQRKCVECWQAKGMLAEETEDNRTTEELLYLYAL